MTGTTKWPSQSLSGIDLDTQAPTNSSSDNTFNLLGEDSIVLSKLLHALSVFLECMGSAASPAALFRMARVPVDRWLGGWAPTHPSGGDVQVRSLLDFVSAVRYHREANVRRAALLAATRTISSTPASLIVSDFLEDFHEVQAWLASVYRDDPDEYCRYVTRHLLKEEGGR